MRYVLGETCKEHIREEIMEKDRPSVFLATSQIKPETAWNRPACSMKGEINLKADFFVRWRLSRNVFAGSLCIPKLLDILGERYKILFFINRHHIVIVDDDEFSYRLIRRIKRKKTRQGESKRKIHL